MPNLKNKTTKLSGFACAFHPAAPGSSPKDTIYAWINLLSTVEKDENKQKEAGIGPI